MNPGRVRIRPAARRDLDAYFDYLIAEAGADTAQSFVMKGRATFAALVDTPGLGPPVDTRNRQLAGLRKWRIDGFPKLTVFYIPSDTEIRIIRVIHAAQDWWSQLDME